MKKTNEQAGTESETAGVSRRKFLESTATAGGVALVAAVNSSCTTAQEGKPQPTPTPQSNAAPQPETPAAEKLRGKMVEYKSGDLMIPAYLSMPLARRVAPGAVLVIHEVFGLNDHIKSIADRVSQAGYVALAPNFFVRAPEPPPKDDSDMDALRKAASSIPPEASVKDMQAGLEYLRGVGGAEPRFASVGFCMGGGFSYRLAASGAKDLKGAVIFYGRMPPELVPQISVPLLGNFGANDTGIPPATVKEIEEALKKAGKKADFKVYEGAGHGFYNDTRPTAYNATAAADAWQRTLNFFRERLEKQ
ncbi:MAG TPA: dienelactone hydrolase family protein [Pyrinomonadaceae bacterium]|nr:dienelactone hydrolase family protein [Pyrinomonadaceae bacterium]